MTELTEDMQTERQDFVCCVCESAHMHNTPLWSEQLVFECLFHFQK